MYKQLLQVAKSSGISLENVTSDTSSSALSLFPAVQLDKAIDENRLVVTRDVLVGAASPRLSRGQALVLVTAHLEYLEKTNATLGLQRDFWIGLPKQYIFAMPFSLIYDLSRDQRIKGLLCVMLSGSLKSEFMHKGKIREGRSQ